jgi:hypothetical protein
MPPRLDRAPQTDVCDCRDATPAEIRTSDNRRSRPLTDIDSDQNSRGRRALAAHSRAAVLEPPEGVTDAPARRAPFARQASKPSRLKAAESPMAEPNSAYAPDSGPIGPRNLGSPFIVKIGCQISSPGCNCVLRSATENTTCTRPGYFAASVSSFPA